MSSNGGFSIIMVMPTKKYLFYRWNGSWYCAYSLQYEKIFILPEERLVVRAVLGVGKNYIKSPLLVLEG
jgi:hypothetical protein